MFALCKPHFSNQPMYYEGRKADISWEIIKEYPKFETRHEARLFWLMELGELKDPPYTEEFVKKVFMPFQRMDQVRVILVKENKNG